MKCYLSFLLAAFLLMTAFVLPVSAARSGDVAGKYYSTDIVTTLNGVQIDAINIDGQTLISAEDMRAFGFAVIWNAEERTLRISETTAQINNPPAVGHSGKPSGSVLGNYYYTDIVTYLEGTPITAYNIGGWTYIHAESMRDFGYTVNWYESFRRLDIISPIRQGENFRIPLSQGVEKQEGDAAVGAFSVCCTKDGITGIGDADYFDLVMQSNGGNYSVTMAFYQYAGLFYSGTLFGQLDPLVSQSYDGSVMCDPTSLYDKIDQVLTVMVNGYRAEKLSIRTGAGNGHRDYIIEIGELPYFNKEQIEEITITLGTPAGDAYPITINY